MCRTRIEQLLRWRRLCRSSSLLGLLIAAVSCTGCRSGGEFLEPGKSAQAILGSRSTEIQKSRELPIAAIVPVAAVGSLTVRSANDASSASNFELSQPIEPQELTVLPTQAVVPIDLATSLSLAGANNPTIAIAAEAIQVSEAELLAARSLLLPTVNAGANYHMHRGKLLASSGIVRNVNSDSLYVGLGANARAAETVGIPGIRILSQLADAIYEPGAARQNVVSTSLEAQAIRNDILLSTAVRYFNVVGAEAQLAALQQSASESREVATMTANFAQTGQGRQSDADRAEGDLLLVQTEIERAEEDVAVAAAELARLLSLDPSTRLCSSGDPLMPITLISPGGELESLVQTAVNSRPEVGSRTAAIAVAQTRLREEQVRPFVPLVSVGFSAGSFGGGSNQVEPRFGRSDGRCDFDAFAVWSLANFGMGNLAIQRERRSEVAQAESVRTETINQVRREVAEAYADVAARSQEIDIARRKLETSLVGFQLDLRRARNLEGRPIEVLNSIRLLRQARKELIRVIVGYNQAQFRLFVALGQPPSAP